MPLYTASCSQSIKTMHFHGSLFILFSSLKKIRNFVLKLRLNVKQIVSTFSNLFSHQKDSTCRKTRKNALCKYYVFTKVLYMPTVWDHTIYLSDQCSYTHNLSFRVDSTPQGEPPDMASCLFWYASALSVLYKHLLPLVAVPSEGSVPLAQKLCFIFYIFLTSNAILNLPKGSN